VGDISPSFLRLGDYLSAKESHHVGRRRVTGAFSGTLHTHDFAELLWLEEGALTHLVNGGSQLLTQGDVVFVRPSDRHTFRPVAGRGFTTVTVAFPAATLAFLQERYFGTARWPWSAGPLPSSHPLGVLQLARLRDLLVSDTTSRLVLERALLEVLDEVTGPTGTRLPGWLQAAIDSVAADPMAQGGGVTALAQLSGRSREHVNRVLRERTGQTATQTLNELRLTRAAMGLRMSDRPIAAVAADC
jgi:AraC family cel operon transcriptional repressor